MLFQHDRSTCSLLPSISHNSSNTSASFYMTNSILMQKCAAWMPHSICAWLSWITVASRCITLPHWLIILQVTFWALGACTMKSFVQLHLGRKAQVDTTVYTLWMMPNQRGLCRASGCTCKYILFILFLKKKINLYSGTTLRETPVNTCINRVSKSKESWST